MDEIKENSLNSYNKPFAKNLRDLLEGVSSPLERKISQKELAEEIGVSRQVISQYCNGATSPNVDTLKGISEFFKVSSDYLIGISSTPSLDIDDKAINKKIGLSDEALQILKKWQKIARGNFLIKREEKPENSIKHIVDPFAFEQQATIDFLLTNEKGKILLSYISDYLYGDYISYDEKDNTRVILHNKKIGYDKPFDIRLLKASLLVNIQNILLDCDSEISQ